MRSSHGAGKSTFFKMLTGQETPDSGSITIGNTVDLAYVDQSRDSLDGSKTVWEEISDSQDILRIGTYEMQTRAYVGRFNFKGYERSMTTDWDEARVRLLSDSGLRNLMKNARNRGSERVAELCALEVDRRKLDAGMRMRNTRSRKASGPHASSGLRKIDTDADELLVRLANDLMTTYDLSKETAQRLSGNRIRPLSLLSKNGKTSKIGGIKKRGEVALFRYISYRMGDATISLAAVLAREGEEQVTWRVDGPDNLVPAKEERYPGTEISSGAWFSNFADAAEKFRELISLLAPKAPADRENNVGFP